MLFTESHKGGEINVTEFEILHRVVRFSDTTARAIMVPRLEMQALPTAITRAELTDFLQHRPHTRIPVYKESLDDIVGIVNSKDLEHLNYQELSRELSQRKASPAEKETAQVAAGSGPSTSQSVLDLTSLAVEAVFVPETNRIDKLLSHFKQRRQQIVIVVDEYGGTAGLVTLADLLEQVFGELPDETDETEPDIVKRPDGSLQISGRIRIDEVNELFGFGFRTDEGDTMAGLVLSALGRTASVGDEVTINGFPIRVEKVDRFRIETLNLRYPEDKPKEEQDE
jgi:CBS domain containing-hemolysin-like protein